VITQVNRICPIRIARAPFCNRFQEWLAAAFDDRSGIRVYEAIPKYQCR
jgi:hypothetical protein